jgi:6-phosphogluconolactonase/glucosamine-6-phosphate isomerase/deaminase
LIWRYERTLQEAYGAPTLDPSRPFFDIVLEERRRWVAAVAHGRPEVRITMTYPVIESSRHVAFLVEGAAKAATLSAITRRARAPRGRIGLVRRPRGSFRRLDAAASHAVES